MAEVIFETYTSKSRAGTWKGATVRGAGQTIATGVVIESPEQFRAILEQFGAKALTAAGEGLYRVAEMIMAESKRLVPVDTGNLRASGHVVPHGGKPYAVEGTNVNVKFGYGGPAGVGMGRLKSGPYTGKTLKGQSKKGKALKLPTPNSVGYAIAVHERRDIRHRVGQSKYLEVPVLQFAGQLEPLLARELRVALEKRAG